MTLIATTVSAAPCPISVSGKMCGKTIVDTYEGKSDIYNASHIYGEIFGLFGKTCNYQYYIEFYSSKCTAGHVLGSYNKRWDTGHDCK